MAKRNYKEEIEHLIEVARKQGYRVRFDWVNRTWRGMNPEAARWLKKHGEYGEARGRIPTKSICVNKSERSFKKKSQVLRHEIVENNKMRHNGHSYPTAHKIANRKQRSKMAVR